MLSLLRSLALLLAGLTLGFAHPARASHAQGGSLTYTSLGGNSYRIRADFFRECSGTIVPAAVGVNCQTTCNGPAVTAMLSIVGQPVIGTPYGSAFQPLAVCPLNGQVPAVIQANFVALRYEGTVTLPPNQWVLSLEENARPQVANLSSPNTLRLEASLDNRTRANTSVTFSSIPAFFVPNEQPNLQHLGAFDADGDSLAYSLVRPLGGCNFYEGYALYPAGLCQTNVISTTPPCLLTCPAITRYSARIPIAVRVDTVGTCPFKTAAPRFAFDSLSGALAFTPGRYVAAPPVIGNNEYVVAVQVTEWRKVGATYVRMGFVRRDMFWVVYNGTNAALPRLAPTVTVQHGTQTTTQPLSAPVAVRVGEPVVVSFTATSTLTATPLSFTLEQNTVPGATVQNGPAAGSGRLTFTPPLGLTAGTYRVSLTVTDDANVRNLITVPVAFRAYGGVLASRSGAAALRELASPNPFTQQVQFQLAQAGVQSLVVCDQLGRVVAHLRSLADGRVQWQPGAEVPAGLYLARTADGRHTVRLLRNGTQ